MLSLRCAVFERLELFIKVMPLNGASDLSQEQAWLGKTPARFCTEYLIHQPVDHRTPTLREIPNPLHTPPTQPQQQHPPPPSDPQSDTPVSAHSPSPSSTAPPHPAVPRTRPLPTGSDATSAPRPRTAGRCAGKRHARTRCIRASRSRCRRAPAS